MDTDYFAGGIRNTGGGLNDSGGGYAGTNANNENEVPGDCNNQSSNPDTTAHPVVIASGTKVKEEIDFVGSGEMPLSVIRTYSSGTGATNYGVFGSNWSSNLDYRLIIGASEIRYEREYGASYTFHWNAETNRWEDSKAQSVSFLIKNPDNTWTLNHESGSVQTYGSDGKIISLKSRTGVGWTFAYSGSTQITVTHSSGRQLKLNLTNGRVSSMIDPDGKQYSYSYTSAYPYILTGVTYPGGIGNRTYHYEDSYGRNLLTGISIDGTRYSTYGYLSGGKVSYSGLVNGVEKSTFAYGSQTTVTNALGGTTTYNYTPVSVNGVTTRKLTSVSRAGASSCPSATAFSSYLISVDPHHKRRKCA